MSAPADFSNLSCWLLGNGAWGQNIRRTLESLRPGYLHVGRRINPPLDLSAVFIATPLATHAELARPLIERGVPVFVEKPLVRAREEGIDLVRAWWGSPKAPLLCDFQHLFSAGFEALADEHKARAPARVSFVATLGGPGPARPDCQPLWDYGSHLVAMALRLGLRDALMNAHLLFEQSTGTWTIEGPPDSPHHVELSVSNKLPAKVRRASIAFNTELAGSYSEPLWLVHREYGPHAGSIERYSNLEDPPLRRAVVAFLSAVQARRTVLGPTPDPRFGLDLPLEVDAVLRRLSPP